MQHAQVLSYVIVRVRACACVFMLSERVSVDTTPGEVRPPCSRSGVSMLAALAAGLVWLLERVRICE